MTTTQEYEFKEAANNVLFVTTGEGYEPGSFTTQLIVWYLFLALIYGAVIAIALAAISYGR